MIILNKQLLENLVRFFNSLVAIALPFKHFNLRFRELQGISFSIEVRANKDYVASVALFVGLFDRLIGGQIYFFSPRRHTFPGWARPIRIVPKDDVGRARNERQRRERLGIDHGVSEGIRALLPNAVTTRQRERASRSADDRLSEMCNFMRQQPNPRPCRCRMIPLAEYDMISNGERFCSKRARSVCRGFVMVDGRVPEIDARSAFEETAPVGRKRAPGLLDRFLDELPSTIGLHADLLRDPAESEMLQRVRPQGQRALAWMALDDRVQVRNNRTSGHTGRDLNSALSLEIFAAFQTTLRLKYKYRLSSRRDGLFLGANRCWRPH